MANATEFQQRVQQLGKLIAELEQMPDSPLKVATGELVQLLMEVHGTGIERMMEIVFDSHGTGAETIDKLGNDAIVRQLASVSFSASGKSGDACAQVAGYAPSGDFASSTT